MKRIERILLAGGLVAAIGAGAAIAQAPGPGASGAGGRGFEQADFHMGPMGGPMSGRFMERLCSPEGPCNLPGSRNKIITPADIRLATGEIDGLRLISTWADPADAAKIRADIEHWPKYSSQQVLPQVHFC